MPPGKLLLVIQLQIYTAPDALPSQASFSTNPSKPVGLDLVDAADQIQHELNLDDEFDLQEALDYFTFDPEYEANDKRFREVKREILGDSEEESQEADDDDEDMDPGAGDKTTVQDLTQQDLVNLRRTIYLTIMSSAAVDECARAKFDFLSVALPWPSSLLDADSSTSSPRSLVMHVLAFLQMRT